MSRSVLMLVALAGLAPAAFAQQGPPVPEYNPADGGAPPRDGPKVNATFDFGGRFSFPSDFSDGPGSVSVARAGGSIDVAIDPSDSTRFIVSFGTEYSTYDFDEDTSIASTNEPWDNVLSHTVAVTYRGKVSPQWHVILAASADASYEVGADFADSLTFGGRVGATYSAHERLTVGLGVLVSTRLEDDPIIIPFPILDWQITDQWSLRTGRGSARGVRLEVAFAPNESLTFSLGGGVEAREFRLDDAGPIPDGVGRDWKAPVSLAVEWKLGEQVTLLGEAGVNLWQNYTIDDANGDELADADADLGFFAGLGVRVRF
ncbi:MAG: hypothetical protein HBSAPP03_11000 [Phycisphaerae bacterium]|nr:MAG: hypothetical protein HBSAPP03_11000 [Phycisphaerae bacterium]